MVDRHGGLRHSANVMLAKQRHDLILEMLGREGTIRVRDLTERFGVSEMTIRRDLDQLGERGLLVRVHGGAASTKPSSSYEPGFDLKRGREAEEKEAIAAEAMELVHPNSVVGLSAGTTTYRLAEHLLAFAQPLTIVTNSPSIAQVAYGHVNAAITTVLTGGIRTPSDALVGPLATAAIAGLHLDVLFLGVHGIDDRLGFTTPNLAEAETNRALIERSSTVVVLADHTKWQTTGLAQIAPLTAVDVVISDADLPAAARKTLTDAGVVVRIAGSGAHGARER